MKPVLVIQHLPNDGPAYLATWLRVHGIAFDVRERDVPADLAPYAALAILGGEMSANDDLPFLRAEEALVRQAVERGVPTLGHCLGGQLMARALGARVRRSPAPEIGWQAMTVDANADAAAWLGSAGASTVFQWHFDAFDLPASAVRIATSDACPNQAFALGPHVALQFHVEVDAAKLAVWTDEPSAGHAEALRDHAATVQTRAAMRAGADVRLAAQQRLADRIYGRWAGIAGIDFHAVAAIS